MLIFIGGFIVGVFATMIFLCVTGALSDVHIPEDEEEKEVKEEDIYD